MQDEYGVRIKLSALNLQALNPDPYFLNPQVIEFGYVTLFASAFPLAGVVSVISSSAVSSENAPV